MPAVNSKYKKEEHYKIKKRRHQGLAFRHYAPQFPFAVSVVIHGKVLKPEVQPDRLYCDVVR